MVFTVDEKQNDVTNFDKVLQEIVIKHIIIDLSCANFIDSQGINCLIQVNTIILKIKQINKIHCVGFKSFEMPTKRLE
jgi:hypothetical protein